MRLVGAPVDELALTLLLSLRFVALVFEEARNIALAVLARGVDWRALGAAGSASAGGAAFSRLADNLFMASERIAEAMVARGFRGPDTHTFYDLSGPDTEGEGRVARAAGALAANALAVLSLVGLAWGVVALGGID